MFEDYLQDAHAFYVEGRKKQSDSDERVAKRYYRASVFYANAAMEAFVNQIALSLKRANIVGIDQHTIAYLNDERLDFNHKAGELQRKQEYHPLDEKLKLLIKSYDNTFDFNIQAWGHLHEIKKFRDALVHPRESEDEIDITTYEDNIKKGLFGIIDIMNRVSTTIYRKPLRRKILDLMPE